MLKAVIFDMDGVIIDSEPLHAQAAVNALKLFGLNISLDFCYGFIGSTATHMLEVIKEQYGLDTPLAELVEANNNEKRRLAETDGYPEIPYVTRLIKNLKENGIKLALASSSPLADIMSTVKKLSLEPLLDVIVSGEELNNPKPAPDIFLNASAKLDVSPSDCVVIEDSYNGITAAKAAGMTRIGFLNPHSGNQDLSGVDFVIEGFEEIDYRFVNQVYLRSKGLPVTITQTERLILRELTVDDIKKMYTDIYSAPEIREFIDDIDDYLECEIEKHKAYIKNVYAFYGYGYWGVFDKESGHLIGRCGIQNNKIDGRTEIELGYLLDVNHWDRGYAVECTKAVLNYAFCVLEIPRIVAVVDKLNIRSQRVAGRIGMKIEKEIKQNGRSCYLYVIEKNKA